MYNNMDKFKLRVYDGVAVAGFLTLPALFFTGLSNLAGENSTAAWLALLIAFAGMSLLFLITICLMKRYAGKNIIQITSAVMGKPLGILYGIVLGIYFCFFTGIHIRESTEILKIYGLSLTPFYLIAGLVLTSAVIMNFFGGRAIVKSAGFFFIIVLAGIAFVILFGLNRYNPDNLVPVLGNGAADIIKNGLYMTSLFDSIIILFLFAPSFDGTPKMKKSGMLFLAVTAAVYIILFICYIMMFPPSVGSKMMSGVIEMGKSSYYNHFFYRFESIILFFMIFSAVMLASIGLFISRQSFAGALKLKFPKTLTVICAVLTAAAAFLPVNMPDLTHRYLPVIRQYSIFFIAGFPLIVLIISTVKRILKYEKN